MAESTFEFDGMTYTEDQLMYLVNDVKDYQITHASLLKGVQFESESSVPSRLVGTSILPTPFPRKCWEEANEIQTAFNELYVRVASDPEWLYKVLKPLMDHDVFFMALWDIYLKVKEAGALQNVVCGVFRSDYMLNQPQTDSVVALKQVEINTFSCAGGTHAERIANMHQHLSQIRRLQGPTIRPATDRRLPKNHNISSIVSLLKSAHDTYTSTDPTQSRPTGVLITVQPYNFNIADERPIEYGLWDQNIPCYRCEWATIPARTTLTPDRTLLFRPAVGMPEVEVSVVYQRAGYAAEEYREDLKTIRLHLELSRAIKCPDLLTHLSTFKAVQQALCEPGAVERFLSPPQAEKVRKTFMPMYVLDSLEARNIATDPAKAEHYVLKPNLEGGGHNIYREDIPTFLASQPEEKWCKYILMRLIEPPTSTGTLMMPQDLYHGKVISELGILGMCMWERKDGGENVDVEMKENKVGGWTFKTKPAEIDEMSVVKGYGCFDCPLLVDF